eukprot:TRINITY_DN1411_c0_g1_i1.p1 TRINITY_DN1411_c0_g1~~TRINITY_DN1411_c0_g1_i1.p1  ORF type:complete len:1066 (+),score=200.57 TRINITY_DN1411_c0_g1_i1:65-3199(+)
MAESLQSTKQVEITFTLPGGGRTVLICQGGETLECVRTRLLQEESTARLLKAPIYSYVLKASGDDDYLIEPEKPLFLFPYVATCMRFAIPITLNLVDKSRIEIDAPKPELPPGLKKGKSFVEKSLHAQIARLIGTSTAWTVNSPEANAFRDTMERLRRREISAHKRVPPAWAVSSQYEKERTWPKQVMTTFHFHNTDRMKKTLQIDPEMTVTQVMDYLLTKLSKTDDDIKGPGSKYIFKPVGYYEFLFGDDRLINYDYIRSQLKKRQSVELVLRVRAEVETEVFDLEDDDEEDVSVMDPTFQFSDIAIARLNWDQWSCIPIWDVDRMFRVRILGVEQLRLDREDDEHFSKKFQESKMNPEGSQIRVSAELCHGGRTIALPMKSHLMDGENNLRFNEWLEFKISTRDLPRECRICFTVWAVSHPLDTATPKDSRVPLGWVNCQLVDGRGHLRSGAMSFKLWSLEAANPIGTCVENIGAIKPSILSVEFDSFALPVVFPNCELPEEYIEGHSEASEAEPSPEELKELQFIITRDMLYELSPTQQALLWAHPTYCKQFPAALPKFMLSVPWNNRFCVAKAHRLLSEWAPVATYDALELLDANYADLRVRDYAVQQLQALDDNELMDFCLQLCQVLKYEPYHDTSLVRMLVARGLRSPTRVGHKLFWTLKAEMHAPYIAERYGLILEAYLRGCGTHRQELMLQNDVQSKLVGVAMAIKQVPDKMRLELLRRKIQELQLPPRFSIPLDPRWQARGILHDRCKYMDSAKKPLWLLFENADPLSKPLFVIFKAGDDLRQDVLTLQIIRLMDKIWQNEGLDLQLRPYACVSTGDDIGMLEVVLDSDTASHISQAEGGGVGAAFEEKHFAIWLRKQNPTEEAYMRAVDTFTVSLAGYCVATYVLGIGDRHNDNIMLSKFGHLFHIDFGHFLGNFKKFLGFDRETAPFVLTPDFAYVMGGKGSENFEFFTKTCVKAYLLLRKHAHLFISLFAMMLSTGMPELQRADDIKWLQTAFATDKTEEEASAAMRKLVNDSLDNLRTRFNFFVHNIAHRT